MKTVLVLGAGLVAGPLVRYLLGQTGIAVTVADVYLEKAQRLIGTAANGTALELDVHDEAALEQLIAGSDLAVSLLPYVYHPLVAQLCVKQKKPMVTASYVKDAMRALDAAAREAGVILLNEIGVDPGIDHMSAMRVIDRIRNAGGKLVSFSSYCGGLPAPDSNNNPFGYKFSWSPRGVLLAGKNPARYLENGNVVDISGEELFLHHWPVQIEGLGTLEGYPNRDCLPYIDTYGIHGVTGMFRGTLRYPGWCETMANIVKLGLLDESPRNDLVGMTFAQFMGVMIGKSGAATAADVAGFLGISPDSPVLDKLAWLGLFSTSPLPADVQSPLDVLAAVMLPRMQYAPGERDMLVMQHQFVAQYPDRRERITATLVDYGIPHGDSSMSRLVGLPAAIGVKLILTGKITLTGVQIPVVPEIYTPVLNELETMGVRFSERTEVISS